jgi:hypothetical protein
MMLSGGGSTSATGPAAGFEIDHSSHGAAQGDAPAANPVTDGSHGSHG